MCLFVHSVLPPLDVRRGGVKSFSKIVVFRGNVYFKVIGVHVLVGGGETDPAGH